MQRSRLPSLIVEHVGMRNMYAEQLSAIEDGVLSMTRLVNSSVDRATYALLEADTTAADEVIDGDAEIDRLRDEIEDRIFEQLALQQPVAGDLRMLMAAVRMIAELERMGDMAVHVAKVAKMRYPASAVPAELVPTMRRAAEVASAMVGELTTIVAERDLDAVAALEAQDEEMDQLRRQQFRIILSDSWSHGIEPAIDLALLGRYYERMADHAVTLARRVIYLVTGEPARS
jgi:phosphate transport system protein